MDKNKILSTILYFVDSEFRKAQDLKITQTELRGLDWPAAFKLAKDNKVLYEFCSNISKEFPSLENNKIEEVISQAKECFRSFKDTVEFIHSLFDEEGIDFIFVKTFKSIPHLTRDIDVLIDYSSHNKAFKILEESPLSETGGKFSKTIQNLGLDTAHYGKPGLLDIDIYSGMPWHQAPTMDDEFLWDKPRSVNAYGVDYRIPNREADFLSMVANNIFTNPYITILDFLYLNFLMKSGLNFDIINKQIGKFGWKEAFYQFLDQIKRIDREVYESDFSSSKIVFPYPIRLPILLKAVLGPVRYQIKREPKSAMKSLKLIGYRCFFGRLYSNIYKIIKGK